MEGVLDGVRERLGESILSRVNSINEYIEVCKGRTSVGNEERDG